jgi:hypothetical protein
MNMKKKRIIRNRISLSLLFFSVAVVMFNNFNTARWESERRVIVHDVAQYYAYLPAVFIHNDFKLKFLNDDISLLGKNFFSKITPTDERVIVVTYGLSIHYLPFFILAHAFAQPVDGVPPGYSSTYKFALQMSSWLYLLIGLIVLRKLLLRYFDDKTTGLVILATVFGSNLLWYVTGEAAMTHVFSFTLITVFLYLADRWVDRITITQTIFLGLLTGMISLIRPTNIIVVLVLVLWKVSTLGDLKNRVLHFTKNWHHILIMILACTAIWLPQFLYWKAVSGQYFYFSYPDDQGFFFNNPQFYNNLFSWRKGWLIYTPVMGFSLIGMALLYKIRRALFWPVTVYFLVAWYIISSWWDWWYGGGFSMRPYIDSYGIFAFGMAAFLTWAFRQRLLLKIALITVFFLAGLLGTYNNMRYHYASIHFDSNTRETYFHDFFSLKRTKGYYETLRKPDYKAARKGIYRYQDEAIED